MTFLLTCAGIIIVFGAIAITGVISWALSWTFFSDPDYAWPLLSWIFSAIGFGVCLTMVLHLKGVI